MAFNFFLLRELFTVLQHPDDLASVLFILKTQAGPFRRAWPPSRSVLTAPENATIVSIHAVQLSSDLDGRHWSVSGRVERLI